MGTFVATVCGCLFAFWGILSPEFKARQRNWEFLGGRALVDPWMIDGKDEDKQGLYGSLFLGRVDDICVVENTASSDEYDLDEFENYTMETDELEQIAGTPYLLRVRMSDDEGRDLQLHARMSEEYIDIEEGMPVTAIMLSTSQSFSNLAAVTDVMVPDADCWVGDYPYLNRPELETLLAEDDELWDLLQSQGTDNFEDKFRRGDDDDEGDNTNELGSFYTEDSEKVPVRRRRK